MKNKIAIGMDIGGTRIKTGVVNLDTGKILSYSVINTIKDDPDAFIKSILFTIKLVLKEAGIKNTDCTGLGIGVPGYVENGFVNTTFGAIPFMEEFPMYDLIINHLQLDIRMDNDARLVALGEALFGAGKTYNRVLCMTLGTGVGMGLVQNKGFLFDNPVEHMAGHMSIGEEKNKCICGNPGCLETYVSVTGLINHMEYSSPKPSAEKWNAEDIFKAANEGHLGAKTTIDNFINNLTRGINNFILLFAPGIIILGGGLSKVLDPFLNNLRKKITAKPYNGYKVMLTTSELSEKAGIYGGAALFF
jgi:glucokinase